MRASKTHRKAEPGMQGGNAFRAGDVAGFDAVKVDRVARAIREARYEINAEAIADRLIASAPAWLRRTRS